MNNLLFALLETKYIILILVGVVIVLAIVLELVLRHYKKKKNEIKNSGIVEEKNTRFTEEDTAIKIDDTPNATYIKGDIILSRGTSYTAGKKQDFISGKYTILSSNENISVFNLRINGLVGEYTHNCSVILGEGDTICPVSHTIILR